MRAGRRIIVKSTTPPIVEIDTESQSAYVRFSNKTIARTHPIPNDEGQIINVDLDEADDVVGIELIGVQESTLRNLVIKAPIKVEKSLLNKARYIQARAVASQAAA